MKIVKIISFAVIFIFLTISFAGSVKADKCIDDCVQKANKSDYYGKEYSNYLWNCMEPCTQKKSSGSPSKERADEVTSLYNILKGEWLGNQSAFRGSVEWPVQFIIEENSIYLYAPRVAHIEYEKNYFTHYSDIPVKINNRNIQFTVLWEQDIAGYKGTSKEKVEFNLTLTDSRTLSGTATYTPKEGWSYSQHTQNVVFRKK